MFLLSGSARAPFPSFGASPPPNPEIFNEPPAKFQGEFERDRGVVMGEDGDLQFGAPYRSLPQIASGNHVVLRPCQGTHAPLLWTRIGFHLHATARPLPFSGELAPRFQVNDATMRRSDWWKGGHANRRLNPDKRHQGFLR